MDKIGREDQLTELISAIKQKKELRHLSQEFVRQQALTYFQQKPRAISILSQPKSEKYKQIVKEIRAKLRRVYGLFRSEEETKKTEKLMAQFLQAPKESLLLKILSLHASTKERIPFYSKLYKKIFHVTGKPHSITDLGCGHNPFSIPFMRLKKLRYYAYDLSEREIALLLDYFKFLHKKKSDFDGQAKIMDALLSAKLEKLPPAEVAFLFKMTDVLDRGKGHQATERVIKAIPAKYVVVSFPTLTMSGKPMNVPRRPWFELMCRRLKFQYTILIFPGEIFYVVKKKLNGKSR